MSTRKQNIISIIIIVVGIILSLFFFNSNNKENEAENEEETFMKKVEIMTIGEDNSKQAEIVKTAVFQAEDSAEIISEYNGRIVNINFEVGDRVAKNQILATFDQSDLVNSAKISLESAQENLELAQDNLEKTKKSVEETLEMAKNNRKIEELKLEQAKDDGDEDTIDLAEKALENAKDAEDKAEEDADITINNSRIQLSQVESTVKQAQISYEKSVIKAPASGVITTKNINQNDFIGPGSVIAEISGTTKFKTKIYLNNFEIGKIDKDQPIEIKIDNQFYSGKILSYSNVANSSNNRYQVEIKCLDDISKEVNRFAEIKIKLSLEKNNGNSFFIPLTAVSIGQKNNSVFVLEDEIAQIKNVEIGKTVGDQIQILAGIKKGDKLIIGNNRNLRNEEKVEIK
jgi:multidrug efflux pump subunit AcrA (membrane-fusion protein)